MKYAVSLGLILLALAMGHWSTSQTSTVPALVPKQPATGTPASGSKAESLLEPLLQAGETDESGIPSGPSGRPQNQGAIPREFPRTELSELAIDTLSDLGDAQLRQAGQEIREALNRVQETEVERHIAAGWANELLSQHDGSFQHEARHEYDSDDIQEVLTTFGPEHPVYAGRTFVVILRRNTSTEYFRLKDLFSAAREEQKFRRGEK